MCVVHMCVHVRVVCMCVYIVIYMQTRGPVSDEKTKLKKENDKQRRSITRLKRENTKQSGESSPLQSHHLECHVLQPSPVPTEEIGSLRREVDYLRLLVSSTGD